MDVACDYPDDRLAAAPGGFDILTTGVISNLVSKGGFCHIAIIAVYSTHSQYVILDEGATE
jgi:hypothetical protein